MDRTRIRQIFREFSGAQRWAAQIMDVKQSAISQWIAAMKSGARIPEDRMRQLDLLATKIEQTAGDCIDDVDGKSVRSRIHKLRSRRKK